VPVPWGVAGTLLAVFFVALPIATALFGGTAAAREEPGDPAWQIAGYIVEQALITAVFLTAIAAFSGATASDLGLSRQFGRGVAIGLIAWLAALLPVQGVQALLFSWFHTPSQHPLVQLVIDKPSPALMVAAFVAAVIVAPICEEIIFRLLLQGWLERLEDVRLGWRSAVQPTAPVDVAAATETDLPTTPSPAEWAPPMPGPPRRGLAGLPYGWAPILISSEMFGLAHFGHGTDPIPLVLLGMILGYTYQRTHKIVPCIVTHMAFNLLSMIVLWRAIETQAV
jgi:membrane protease YdiL (CAAX protease family)